MKKNKNTKFKVSCKANHAEVAEVPLHKYLSRYFPTNLHREMDEWIEGEMDGWEMNGRGKEKNSKDMLHYRRF